MSWRDGIGQNSTLEQTWQSLKGPTSAKCQALETLACIGSFVYPSPDLQARPKRGPDRSTSQRPTQPGQWRDTVPGPR